jgi:hypothetical protein
MTPSRDRPIAGRTLDHFSTRGVCHFQCARARCIWYPFIAFGDRRKHFLTNFKYFKGNKTHFKAFGVIFLHNKVDKTYQGGNFHKIILFFVLTYLKSPTSSPMRFWRFWRFKCVMAKTLENNEKLFARISGNRCYSYMDWHKKSIGLVKFALDSSNLNAVRRFTHLPYWFGGLLILFVTTAASIALLHPKHFRTNKTLSRRNTVFIDETKIAVVCTKIFITLLSHLDTNKCW